MPDGSIPTQFVAEQLNVAVAPPAESHESNVDAAVTAESEEEEDDDDGAYIL